MSLQNSDKSEDDSFMINECREVQLLLDITLFLLKTIKYTLKKRVGSRLMLATVTPVFGTRSQLVHVYNIY